MPRLMDSVSLANCQVRLPIFVLFLLERPEFRVVKFVRDISVSCFVSAFFPSSYISCFMQDSSIWCLLSVFWFRSICEIFAPKSPTSHLFWMTKSNWRKKILLKSCSRDSTGTFLNLSSWATCFGSNPFTRRVEDLSRPASWDGSRDPAETSIATTKSPGRTSLNANFKKIVVNMTRRLWPSDSRHSTTEHPLTIMIQLFLRVSSSWGKVASRISYVWTSLVWLL